MSNDTQRLVCCSYKIMLLDIKRNHMPFSDEIIQQIWDKGRATLEGDFAMKLPMVPWLF